MLRVSDGAGAECPLHQFTGFCCTGEQTKAEGSCVRPAGTASRIRLEEGLSVCGE